MSDHFDTCPVCPWLKELAVPIGWELGRPPPVSLYLVGKKSLAPLGIQPQASIQPLAKSVITKASTKL